MNRPIKSNLQIDTFYKICSKSILVLLMMTGILLAQDSKVIKPEREPIFRTDTSVPYDQNYFVNPTDHKIVLSGSFGELRSNHFHAGLDIKPKKYGNIGEPIYAAANGYISRIKIARGGYGRALYIDHLNGYTTVYAHMQTFSDSIELYLEKMQYELKSFEVDIYLNRGEITVNQGNIIGTMGSTGRSFGAHLHFEIRETNSEIPINPMLFGIKPSDKKYPLINSLAIHSLTPDNVTYEKHKFGTKTISKGNYKLDQKTVVIPAWTIGVAVHSFDKMDGANNTNGIYSLMMYVDDSLQYGFTMDKVSFAESGQINAHIDYKTKINENSTFQRCYRLPGNSLSIYENNNDGTIKLYKDKVRKVKIVVKDVEDNTSTLEFDVKRAKEMVPPKNGAFNFIAKNGKRDTFRFGNIATIFKEQSVYNKAYLECIYNEDGDFSIGDKTIPLHQSIDVLVKQLPKDKWSSKRCIAWNNKGSLTSYGGEWNGSILRTSVRKLGDFKVVIDTIKPVIKIVKFPKSLKKNQSIKLKVQDNLRTKSLAKELSIEVFIDGIWHLYQYSVTNNIATIKLKNNLQLGKHTFLLRAEDDRGNINTFVKEFVIIQ